MVRNNNVEGVIIVLDVVGNILSNCVFYVDKEDGKAFIKVDTFYFSSYIVNSVQVKEIQKNDFEDKDVDFEDKIIDEDF